MSGRLAQVLALVATAVAATGPAPARATPLHRYGGTLEIRHTDDFARGRATTHYELRPNGGGSRVALSLPKPTPIRSGSKVVLTGRRAGARLKGSLRVASKGAAGKLAAAVTARPRKVAVILVQFDALSPPWTPDEVRQRVFTDPDSVNAFYREDSYGDVSLVGNLRADGDVFGWYRIPAPGPDPNVGCDVDAIARDAQAAATADGFVADDYDHVIYAFPYQSMCAGWAGLGEVPGTQSWINGYVDEEDVVAHELGHNMGLAHASALDCTDAGVPVAIGPSCTTDEYGDPFDVMGNSVNRNNAWHLDQIGFMAPARVRVANGDGTYTLDSTNTRTAGTQLLRVRRPAGASPAYYDLELRSSGGVFDDFLSTDPPVTGVTIHTDPETTTLTRSLLIDTTPGSPDGFWDAPLAVGHTFSDGKISISVRSISGGVATVGVSTGAPPVDVNPPSVPGPVTATASSDRVVLSWPAATDDFGVAGYRVYRGSTQIGTTTSDLTWTDFVVSPGASYGYRVAACDAAGHVSTSAPVTVTIPSPSRPPTTSTNPTSTNPRPGSSSTPQPPATGGGRDSTRPRVRIESPSRHARVRRRATVRAVGTDKVRVVRMEVWVDLRRRKSVRGSKLSWSWVLRHARPGRHVVAVRAIDAAGNEATATVRPFVVR